MLETRTNKLYMQRSEVYHKRIYLAVTGSSSRSPSNCIEACKMQNKLRNISANSQVLGDKVQYTGRCSVVIRTIESETGVKTHLLVLVALGQHRIKG